MKAPDEPPPLPVLDPPPEPPPPSSADDHLAEARVRRHLRVVLKPLAYCRPDNDQGRRR